MTSELIAILKNRGLYVPTTIKELENSPCDESDADVLDLLSIKERHFGLKIPSGPMPKSISGIFIKDETELLFIHTIIRKKDESADDFIKSFSQHRLLNKVSGTVEVLDDIVSYYGHSQDFETLLKKHKSPRIKTIVLIDLPIGEFLNIRLTYGDELNIGTNNPVTEDIIFMNCEEFKDIYC